ncbi:TPA: hypothetical protein EYO57_28250, partial [Candidatus Poribacteria bacterium]|nr:hypothetical protein [Candidatus Poribacteria bacterium]
MSNATLASIDNEVMCVPTVTTTQYGSHEGGKIPSILVLGMACGEKIRCNYTYQKDWNSYSDNIRCGIMKHDMSMQQARDLVRIHFLQQETKYLAFTMSKSTNTPNDWFHTFGDYSHKNIVDELVTKYKMSNVLPFYNVILDYFWNPPTYMAQNVSPGLFCIVLPELVKTGTLFISDNYEDDGGVIWLPFSMYFLECTVLHADILSAYFIVSFITSYNRDNNPLLRATKKIDRSFMLENLGKNINQEDIYCCVDKKNVDNYTPTLPHTERSMADFTKLISILQQMDNMMFIRYKAITHVGDDKKRTSYLLDSVSTTRFLNHIGGIYIDQTIIKKCNGKKINIQGIKEIHQEPS